MGTATLNGEARVAADVLEITVPIAPEQGEASPPATGQTSTMTAVLLKGMLREAKLCTTTAELAGLQEQCYSKAAVPTPASATSKR